MKRLFNIILILILAFTIRLNVEALSSSLKVSSNTIENGGSVKATVTISGAAAWNIKIFSSGATNGCDASYADATSDGKNTTKSFTVTCKSSATGVINFSVTGDITSEDGTNKSVSASKTVTVTKPREKSTNNYLSSLSVEGYEISPKFSKDTLEYSVDVPNTVEKIIINAKKADSYASVSGTGEVEVIEGANKFLIVVTSETGKDRTYTLNVNVEDNNPIKVNVDGKDYTIVKNKRALTLPELFSEITVEIDGFTIPAFYSEITKTTLVGLKTDEGEVKLFVYNDGKYEKYSELKVANTIIRLMNNNKTLEYYKKDTVIINDVKYDCYKLSKKSDFSLIYGMNMATGKLDYYIYDSIEQTVQRYDDEILEILNNELKEKDENTKILYIIIAVLIVFVIFVIILFSVKNSKIKKSLGMKKDKKKNSKEKQEKTILD